jgi:ribonuclease BN (tRNA processing enzyme)
MEARLLGSGGWMPTDERETTCLYVRQGAHVLLVDAGSGLRRLVTEPALLDGVERLSIVLTHFHIDHLCGLPFLHDLEHVAEREVWGAGDAVLGMPTEELLHRLLDPPFFPSFGLPATVHELAPPHASIGDFEVELRVQPRHAHPTLAVRVDSLAFCTDTAYDEDNVAFATGARVLCHEAFHAAETTDDRGHTASGDAARLAAAAGVDRLVLVHVDPLLGDDEKLLRFARPHFPAAEVGRDGLELLPGGPA